MRLQKDGLSNSNPNRLRRDDGKQKHTRYYSSRQEQAIASAVNGKQTANSGATAFSKGDVTVGNKTGWLIEAKTCMKDQKTFTLHEEWFKKNIDESIFMKKDHTAVVFNFGPDKPNYYCVDEQTFLRMKELLDQFGDD